MKGKCFLKKAVFPTVLAIALMALFYPLCVENGACGYWKLWIFAGIPFGIHRLYFCLIPKGSGLGGTVGMFAFQLLIGGAVGGVVPAWRLVVAVFWLAEGVLSGAGWTVKKAVGK